MFNQQMNPSIDKSVWGTPECLEPYSFHIKQLFYAKGGKGEGTLGLLGSWGLTGACRTAFPGEDVNKHLFSAHKAPSADQRHYCIQVQLGEPVDLLGILTDESERATSLRGSIPKSGSA